MLEKCVFGWTVAAALLTVSGTVLAASATTVIPVSANVSQACTISTVGGGIAFGNYDPVGANATAALNATGTISVTCSKGAKSLTIGIDFGANAVATQRNMKGASGTTPLQYALYQPPSNLPGVSCTFPATIPWTNATGGMLTLPESPSKVTRTYNVCATIPGAQDVTVESYSDTVTATLNF